MVSIAGPPHYTSFSTSVGTLSSQLIYKAARALVLWNCEVDVYVGVKARIKTGTRFEGKGYAVLS